MSKKTILIAGGSGLIGKKLVEAIDSTRFHIHVLSRFGHKNNPEVSYFKWDIDKEEIEANAVKADVIINLVGAGIADKRWTEDRKRVLIKSRVESADLLLKSIITHNIKPELYLSASAIGFYGSQGAQKLTETDPVGTGFLSECCQKWEEGANRFIGFVDRVAVARIGIVLSNKGGALPKMLMTKSLGIYSYFGNGEQIYSWIHIDDLVGALMKILSDKNMQGAYNLVAPNPVTNRNFMQICKEVYGGFMLLPVPGFLLNLLMGEMSHAVLDSANVRSALLQSRGFRFSFPTLAEALKDLRVN